MIDNFIKGPLTSILGLVAMGAAGYGWWIDHLTDMQASGLGLIGFCLLFMRDKLPDFISRWLNKKIDDGKPGPPASLIIVGLLSLALSGYGQSTDATLTTQSNVIRDEAVAGANTKTRIAAMYQAIIDSKVNRGELITATGTNTYTVTGPAGLTLARNPLLLVKFTNGNTGPSTINVTPSGGSALGAVSIRKDVSSALSSGDIDAGQIFLLVYDGTNFQLIGSGAAYTQLADGPGAFTGKTLNYSRVNAGETALEYRTPSQAKSDIGLGNADNTSDANKPVSTAQSTAINAKVADAINDGTTSIAPSQNSVFDALALKEDALGFTPLDPNSNLSDLANPAAALKNLGALHVTPNTQTGDYTLLASDFNAYTEIIMNSATPRTITVPDGLSLDIGAVVFIRRIGAANVTIAQGPGQTVTATSGSLTTPAQAGVQVKLQYDGSGHWNFQNGLPNPDAVANGTTKGVATYTASDFNTSDGVVAIDYTNGQSASSTTKGYLPAADWVTFNNKISGNPIALAYQALGSTVKAQTVNYDVTIATASTFTLANNVLRGVPIYVESSTTLTDVIWYQKNTASFTANNNNKIGLYSYSAGTMTLVASSTNDGNLWQTATLNTFGTKAFSTPYVASPGLYFIALLYCRSATSTDPTIGQAANITNNAVSQLDFTNSAKMFWSLAAQTDLPSTIAMSSVTVALAPIWAAVR